MKTPTLKTLFTATSLLVALSSCGQQTFDVVHTQDQSEAAGATSIAPKIDIVLAVDNSGSAYEIQNRLNASLRTFLIGLNQQNWDFRVTAIPLIGTPSLGSISASKFDANTRNWVQPYPDAPKTSTIPSSYYVAPESYSVSTSPGFTTGVEPGLSNIGTFLNQQTTQNYFIRKEAALAIIVLSNGNDTSDGTTTIFPYGPVAQISNSLLSSIRDSKGMSLGQTVHLFPVVTSKGTRYKSIGQSLGGHTPINLNAYNMDTILTLLRGQLEAITLNFTKRYIQIAKRPNEDTIRVTKFSNGQSISVPKSINGSAGWRYIGNVRVPMVSVPIEMDFRTGYTIELVGGMYDLIGKDSASVDYLEYGVNPSTK